jgi:hypothetical protein
MRAPGKETSFQIRKIQKGQTTFFRLFEAVLQEQVGVSKDKRSSGAGFRRGTDRGEKPP